jgi:hypothetical protein
MALLKPIPCAALPCAPAVGGNWACRVRAAVAFALQNYKRRARSSQKCRQSPAELRLVLVHAAVGRETVGRGADVSVHVEGGMGTNVWLLKAGTGRESRGIDGSSGGQPPGRRWQLHGPLSRGVDKVLGVCHQSANRPLQDAWGTHRHSSASGLSPERQQGDQIGHGDAIMGACVCKKYSGPRCRLARGCL